MNVSTDSAVQTNDTTTDNFTTVTDAVITTTVGATSSAPASTGYTTEAELLINATIDGDMVFWSMAWASVATAIVYVIMSVSFIIYIHAVHRKITLKPWMRRSATDVRRESSRVGKKAIELIDVRIQGRAEVNSEPTAADNKMSIARLRVCREIISTEVSYCKVIDQLMNFYYARLETSLKYDTILPKADLDVIFRHCASLQKLHQTLLDKIDNKALETRKRASKALKYFQETGTDFHRGSASKEQLEAREAVVQLDSLDFVFDVFSEMIPFFRAYTAFCNNFDLAQTKIHECVNERPKFRKFLERCRQDPQFTGLDMEDLLIQPVQRICRYPLLFAEALKNMLPSHSLYEKLTKVNDEMKGIAAEVDKAREIAQNSALLSRLHRDVVDSKTRPIKFTDVDFIIPSRTFLRRFDAQFEDRFEPKAPQQCNIFIFNDLVMLTTEKVVQRHDRSGDGEHPSHREMVSLVAEYVVPMSGLKCSWVDKKPISPVVTEREWREMAELRFTCTVNMKSRTAVLKFSVVFDHEEEAKMLYDMISELKMLTHRKEADKTMVGSVAKKSWVRKSKQGYLDKRAAEGDANAGMNDVAASLRELRKKYNKHVEDVFGDALNTPRLGIGGDDFEVENNDPTDFPTSPTSKARQNSDAAESDGEEDEAARPGETGKETADRQPPEVPEFRRARPQPTPPPKKAPPSNRNGFDPEMVDVLRTILNDPYLNGSADASANDPQVQAVRSAVEEKLGRKMTPKERAGLQKELLNRRMTKSVTESYADRT